MVATEALESLNIQLATYVFSVSRFHLCRSLSFGLADTQSSLAVVDTTWVYTPRIPLTGLLHSHVAKYSRLFGRIVAWVPGPHRKK